MSSRWWPGSLFQLAHNVGRRAMATTDLHNAGRPAQPGATLVTGAVTDDRVTPGREHDRVRAAGADPNVPVDARAGHRHGPGPWARCTWSGPANAVQMTTHGAIRRANGASRGSVPGTRRRERGQADGDRGETGQRASHAFLDAAHPLRVAPVRGPGGSPHGAVTGSARSARPDGRMAGWPVIGQLTGPRSRVGAR